MMQAKPQDAARRATDMLSKSSIRDLRHIRVDETDEALELSGTVRSYYHKQLAQETVRSVASGRQLINRVEVR